MCAPLTREEEEQYEKERVWYVPDEEEEVPDEAPIPVEWPVEVPTEASIIYIPA